MTLRRSSMLAQPLALACAVACCAATALSSVASAQTSIQSGTGPNSAASVGGSGAKPAVRDARPPLAVRIDDNGAIAKDAVQRLLAAMRENPNRLITISLGSIDPNAGGNAAKQDAIAKQLLAVMNQVKKAQPGAALAVRGLPLESVAGSKAAARAVNDRFAKVIAKADALVLTGGVIGKGSGKGAHGAVALAKTFPEAMRLAGSKAVLFKNGEGWKSRVVDAGVPSVSDGLGGSDAPQQMAATGGASFGGVGGDQGEVIGDVLGGWGGSSGVGDLNGDGVVDAIDLAIALSMSGTPSGGNAAPAPVVIVPPAELASGTAVGVVDGEAPVPPQQGEGGGEVGGESGGDESASAGGGDAPSDPPADPPTNPPANGGGSPLDQLFLLNGPGFNGATPAPPQVGSPSAIGYNAHAIARWSTVPFQTFKENLRVGVVAFHRNGIERVAFSANGGAWIDATEMTINPSTGVSEYWVTLRGQDFPDGAVEIRAIAYPKSAGKPRLLAGAYQASASAPPPQNGEHSMFAWANFGGTLDRDARYVSATGDDAAGDGSANNPYRTLSRAAQAIQAQYGSCDNATIYCLPGEYDFEMKWGFTAAKANDRYITITTAPGILREQVVIEEARPKTARIRLNNVSIKTNDAGNFYTGFTDLRAVLWLDNCFVTTKNGRYGSTQKVLSTCTPYVTESVWHDAPDGPTDAVLVRNSTITKLCSDMVSGVQVVLNVTGSDIDPANTGAHPDIYQIFRPSGSLDNHVIYGVRATNFLAQGIFIAALANGEKIRNTAFVNIVLDANQSNFTSQINRDSEHLLLVNCTVDQTFFIRTPGFNDVSFVGNIFRAVTVDLAKCTPAQVATIDWRHNHFVDSTSYGVYIFGTDVTTGPAPVVNWAMGNYTPLPSGGLVNRLERLHSNYDAAGLPREPMTAIGALEDQ
jgi:hypothetical protein